MGRDITMDTVPVPRYLIVLILELLWKKPWPTANKEWQNIEKELQKIMQEN